MWYLVSQLLLAPLLLAQETDHYYRLLHTYRLSQGLTFPSRRSELDQSAQAFARELASRGELSHRDSLRRGPEHRAAVMGLGLAGEVLGYGPQPAEVFDAWLKSPGHRRVLDNPVWRFFGVGVEPLGNGHVVVIVFWAPP